MTQQLPPIPEDFDAYKHEWDNKYSNPSSFNRGNNYNYGYDNNSKFRTSKIYVKRFASSKTVVTNSIVFLSVVLYLLSFIMPNLTYYLGYIPFYAQSSYYTVFTSAVMHSGFFHILCNMMILLVVGQEIERYIGSVKMFALSAISAIGACALINLETLIFPSTVYSVTVGASGIIYGLLGAILVSLKRTNISTKSILVLLGINLIMSLITPSISFMGHLGGFLFGLGYSYAITNRKVYRSKPLSILVSVAFIAVTYMIATTTFVTAVQ